jgi:hypothetical protein
MARRTRRLGPHSKFPQSPFKKPHTISPPQLKQHLPEINPLDLAHGNFYMNLHIVTARKPRFPRTGDLLVDGSRQGMTPLKEHAMAGRADTRPNQWQRFDLDVELTLMLGDLAASDVSAGSTGASASGAGAGGAK